MREIELTTAGWYPVVLTASAAGRKLWAVSLTGRSTSGAAVPCADGIWLAAGHLVFLVSTRGEVLKTMEPDGVQFGDIRLVVPAARRLYLVYDRFVASMDRSIS